MSRNTRTFTDLDFNFFKHPITDDVAVRYDENAIKQSIKSLIMTKNYERPFRSYIGSQVNALLFDNISAMTTTLLRKAIIDVITNFEPRVDVLDVIISYAPDENSVDIGIIFKIKNTQNPLTIDIILERTR